MWSAAPWGLRLSYQSIQESQETYRKGHVQKLQKQTNPKLLRSLQQSYLSLWEVVAQTGVGFVVLTTHCQYKHWWVKGYTPARGTAWEKAGPVPIDSSSWAVLPSWAVHFSVHAAPLVFLGHLHPPFFTYFFFHGCRHSCLSELISDWNLFRTENALHRGSWCIETAPRSELWIQ